MYCVFARLTRPVQRLTVSQAIPFATPGGGTPARSAPSTPADTATSRTAITAAGTLARVGDTLLWRFEVGVGDRYFLVPQLRPTGPATLRAELLDREGQVLCESTHELAAGEPPGRLRIRSCTSINAGTYHARFTLLSGAAVGLDSLVIE